MKVEDQKTPTRGAMHDALEVFLGEWKAEGASYGGPGQDAGDPKANAVPWVSTHTARWHTGGFFLIQDEKARPGGEVFDTLAVIGVDAQTGRCFARQFENHGFHRDYDVTVEGPVWTYSGDRERATITFSDDGRRQAVVWEWRPQGTWLPLCERTAVKVGD